MRCEDVLVYVFHEYNFPAGFVREGKKKYQVVIRLWRFQRSSSNAHCGHAFFVTRDAYERNKIAANVLLSSSRELYQRKKENTLKTKKSSHFSICNCNYSLCAVALPSLCCCHSVAMLLPFRCYALPCRSHAFTVLSPCRFHGVATLMQCFAMLFPCCGLPWPCCLDVEAMPSHAVSLNRHVFSFILHINSFKS